MTVFWSRSGSCQQVIDIPGNLDVQLAEMKSMNEREWQTLVDKIEGLHGQIELQSADQGQPLAALTDQREKVFSVQNFHVE